MDAVHGGKRVIFRELPELSEVNVLVDEACAGTNVWLEDPTFTFEDGCRSYGSPAPKKRRRKKSREE